MKTVLTWLWRDENCRTQYDYRHVNIWAEMIRRNATGDYRVACVTNMAEGIHPSITIIPLPEWEAVKNSHWSPAQGHPQCYRRLDMFRPDAAYIYGERIIAVDLDVVILRNIDHIVHSTDDFRIAGSQVRWYNGALLTMDAGARSDVYTRWNANEAEAATAKHLGSDQAWIAHILGEGEKTWTGQDGVAHFSRHRRVPRDAAMLFFPGKIKPWHHNQHGLRWLTEIYRIHSDEHVAEIRGIRRRGR
jgi:hypothetical protein